jgi:hypothetical protein
VKLTYSFRSLADWHDLKRGKELVDVLKASDFVIEKVDDKEPIRKNFEEQRLPNYWVGRGLPGQHSTCYFLFKGSRPYKFSGMVTWKRDLPTGSTWLNTLHLDITISGKSRPESDALLNLGDKLFSWSQAVHGFITDAALYSPLVRPPAMRLYIPKLFWVNYFGQEYLSNPDFRIAVPSTTLRSGVRVDLGSIYDDPRSADEGYLREAKMKFGLGWFGEGKPDELRMPAFDFSALCKE